MALAPIAQMDLNSAARFAMEGKWCETLKQSRDSEGSVASSDPSNDTNTLVELWSDADVPKPGGDDPDVQFYHGLPYIQLSDEYNKRLCWSNNPIDLKLPTYFNPNQELSLAKDFNVQGLCPVLTEKDDCEVFILRDAKCRYYLWDEWDGHLLRFQKKWVEGFPSKEKMIMNLICNLTWAQQDTDVISCDREED
ncbi:hypothetical protein N0V83_007034 [Neocucurbitaria cava]|uniref:Uncharacterized protein n=1 Tax=Neocucurbitaria cava TaxID=798079 RepID=A0A9W8Y4R5_9PLEO|nr:hypothetical protein N0V83_007034 [Neocucurbitaria cava]